MTNAGEMPNKVRDHEPDEANTSRDGDGADSVEECDTLCWSLAMVVKE